MKKICILKILTGIVLAASVWACSKDIEPVLNNQKFTLGGTKDDVILLPEAENALALTLYWSGDYAAEETIQFAADENFTRTLDIKVERGVRERQFLAAEINAMLGRLDFPGETLAPLYVRICSRLTSNAEPTYSTVLKVNVKTYVLHLDFAAVLDKDQSETGVYLHSAKENGVYEGFMGVGAWYKWFLRENNGNVWGNVGEDGHSFEATTAESHWNFWFPGISGCYFTTVNTVEAWWSALNIVTISADGDVKGEMSYNQTSNQWSIPVSMPAAGIYKVTLSCVGKLYDRETGADGPAKDVSCGFSGDASALAFGNKSGAISVNLPAGATTLVLDLSKPGTYTLAAGEAAPVQKVSPVLYLSGIVNWNGFDDQLSLYNEESLSYGGAHYFKNCEWGYQAFPQAAWTPVYKAAKGSTALEGVITSDGSGNNFPSPGDGLFVMDFNLSAKTYKLTKVDAVSYAGLNDDWSEKVMTQSAENPEVFTAEVVKKAASPWGVKILVNHDWTLFFGGAKGKLTLGHDNATTGFDGDNALANGTYILTVDLGAHTYNYKPKQ